MEKEQQCQALAPIAIDLASSTSQSHALAFYRQFENPMTAIETLGEAMFRSAMFGAANPQQGAVIVWTCMMEGITPMEFKRRYHLVDGNPTMRYDYMLAKFRERGGRYRVIERTPQKASVELTFMEQTLTFTMTWQDALKEEYIYAGGRIGDEKSLKKNWRTERGRQTMLWSRVVTDGVRTMAPEIVAGVASSDEAEDYSVSANPQSITLEQPKLMPAPESPTVMAPVSDPFTAPRRGRPSKKVTEAASEPPPPPPKEPEPVETGPIVGDAADQPTIQPDKPREDVDRSRDAVVIKPEPHMATDEPVTSRDDSEKVKKPSPYPKQELFDPPAEMKQRKRIVASADKDGKLTVETQKELMNLIGDYQTQASAYLAKINWLSPGETLADMRAGRAQMIFDKPEAFISTIKAFTV